MPWGPLVTALVTPFDPDGNVCAQRFDALMDHVIAQSSTGIVVGGTTGESPTISDEEKVLLYRQAVRGANRRVHVIASTGSNDTAHTVELSQRAQQCGVDALMVVTPYYNRPSQLGIIRHVLAVAERVPLPILLYNIPSRTGIAMTVETVCTLAEHPRIVALKDSSGDVEFVSDICAQTRNFSVYSGDDALTLPYMSVGACGVVSVASHLIGETMRVMMKAHADGDVALAAQWHASLLPMFRGLFCCPHRVPNPVPIKYALRMMGIDVGSVRLPLVDVTEEEAQFLRALLAQYGLLDDADGADA
jgi:4-hydroxy-tetrahydrodipicolinate synthase